MQILKSPDRWTWLALVAYLTLAAFIFFPILINFGVMSMAHAPWHLQELHQQAWVIHALLEDPMALPHVNYFYPLRYTIVLTEPRILMAILGAPAYLLSGSFLQAFNLAYLLVWPLCALSAFVVCRAATGSAAAGFVGGLVFGFGPYQQQFLGQIVLLYAMFVPLGLALAWRLGSRPSLPTALLLGLVGALQFLACAHHACYLAYGAGGLVLAALVIHGNASKLRPWGLLLLSGALALAAVSWVLVSFIKGASLHDFVGQDWQGAVNMRIDLTNLLLPSTIHGPLSEESAAICRSLGSMERTLFPGLIAAALAMYWGLGVARLREGLHIWRAAASLLGWVLLLLGALALISLIPKEGLATGPLLTGTLASAAALALWIYLGRRLGAFALVRACWAGASTLERTALWGMLAVALLALGPVVYLLGRPLAFGPGFISHNYIPGFDLGRVPLRIGVLLCAGQALFAAKGYALLTRRLPGPASVALSALLLFIYGASFGQHDGKYIGDETLERSLSKVSLDQHDIPVIYQWVASLPGDPPLLTLPVLPEESEAFLREGPALESVYMYYSTRHFKPLVCGVTSFVPPRYVVDIRPFMLAFPEEQSLSFFESIGVRYALFHEHFYTPRQWQQVLQRINRFPARLRLVRQEGGVSAYELIQSKAAVPKLPARSSPPGGA